jgi:hypothetical protein
VRVIIKEGIYELIYQLGPGNCLGLLAGKSGPTAVRGQYYATAAAIGKVGAFVGTWGMCFLRSLWDTRLIYQYYSLPSHD